MTTSNWNKVLKQLEGKPAKKQKYVKHNKPSDRAHGRNKYSCQRCGSRRGLIRKYELYICRRCFRETATDMGFKKFR